MYITAEKEEESLVYLVLYTKEYTTFCGVTGKCEKIREISKKGLTFPFGFARITERLRERHTTPVPGRQDLKKI